MYPKCILGSNKKSQSNFKEKCPVINYLKKNARKKKKMTTYKNRERKVNKTRQQNN